MYPPLMPIKPKEFIQVEKIIHEIRARTYEEEKLPDMKDCNSVVVYVEDDTVCMTFKSVTEVKDPDFKKKMKVYNLQLNKYNKEMALYQQYKKKQDALLARKEKKKRKSLYEKLKEEFDQERM